MKHLKKISITPQFPKKDEFNAFLFDLISLSDEVKIEYGRYDKDLVIHDISRDPKGLIKPIIESDIQGVIISIEFRGLESIEKTSEFYNCITECVERFSEKYGERFKYRGFKPFYLVNRISQKGSPMVAYIFFINS